MARKKSNNKWLAAALGFSSLVTAFIIGGMFIQKTTTGNVVLQYVPSAIHPVIGWGIVLVAGVLGITGVWKMVKKGF